MQDPSEDRVILLIHKIEIIFTYTEKVSSWFGKTAKINYLPWEDWCKSVSEEESIMTWDHIAHSPNCSIEKARSLLGYQPHYSSLQALQESVSWLVERGIIKLRE